MDQNRVRRRANINTVMHFCDLLTVGCVGFYLLYKDKFEYKKIKGKGRLLVLQHCCLEAYCTLTRMSSFIHLQRRCTHQAA